MVDIAAIETSVLATKVYFILHCWESEDTVNPLKDEATFSRVSLFLVLILKVHTKISGSTVFHRFLFKRSIPKLAG